MAAMLGDDDFDQFDKPGAERSRRRRTADDDWDSELEDDLLQEDYLPGKKASPDLSDEELNDDLLQSDEEDQDQQNFSAQGVAISLNATAGGMSSFDLSKSMNESVLEEPEYEEGESEAYYEEIEEPEGFTEDLVESYEENDADLPEENAEYVDDETAEEVLELEINDPIDEFQEDEYLQSYKKQQMEEEPHYEEDNEDHVAEVEETGEMQETANDAEEINESQEFPSEIKEESDEEEDEEEGDSRIRFKTERKEGTIIRLSDVTRERRNIPETLELSAEAKASLMEFEEMERQRKQGRYGSRRGGRRGGNNTMPRGMLDHRHENQDRRNMREHPHGRPPQGPIRSLMQQHQIQPLLPMQRPRNPSCDGMSSSPQQEKSRHGGNALLASPQQPKNIHINPHFKGNVTPVQVPVLPVPNQPRPPVGPPRFQGPPEFQHIQSPVPGNFNQPPRLQEPWRNPPPQPEREPFFMGEPRFPNHHVFDQRNPPPIPPPPLLNNHPVPNQNQIPFNPPGQGFNQPGPQPRFNQPGPQPNFNQHGPQPGFNQHGPQPGFNQPGYNPPGPQPGFNQPGPQPGFNQPGHQPNFNQPGHPPGFNQPGFNQPGPQPGFNHSGPQPPFNQPGFNQPGSGPQQGFNQQGPGPQPGFNQPGPGSQSGFNQPGFSRERPVRMNMPSPGHMGIPPFNQNTTNRHFTPPRQQFQPGPGQPFMSHTPPNMQGPMQPPMQQMHQHHHLSGHPKPPGPMQQQFRPHLQNPQTPSNNRMQGQQRQGAPKLRQNTPGQNMGMGPNQQAQHARKSNLRELPIAPSHSLDMAKRRSESVPAAQVKPVGTTAPRARTVTVGNPPMMPTGTAKEEVKVEEQFADEDEETRKYRLKIEEQKRLREEILKRKELRRQLQAGARKKELLERLSQQIPTASHPGQTEPEKQPSQVANSNPILAHTGTPARPNVKNRLVPPNSGPLPAHVPQGPIPMNQTPGSNAQPHGPQKKMMKPVAQSRVVTETISQKVLHAQPAPSAAMSGTQQTLKVLPVQGKPQGPRPAGTKRTVMQRTNSGSGDGAHIVPKVRVIKISGVEGENVCVASSQGIQQTPSPHRPQPPLRPQQFQQRHPQQPRLGSVRKVTLGRGGLHHPYNAQGQQRPQHHAMESAVPQVVNSVQGVHQPNKVIMRGRGRGVVGQMGRGRLMPNKQNLRVVECTPQPCVVSLEGLSSSTSDHKLKNLLMSVGPIQSFQMFPHERKAIATFKEPHHASAFQQKFHRHMIDLSHINVSLVGE
ncbi:RNA-binding protein 33 isoform X2 [Spea bombifrons]|uniref:RNA-binding protein 33 isoform X2 n=1 Tax=Spea bombifrons TaxID=233779 RepID=UPI00234A2070|nr:RNA-binding protein 33 isoform X2 [Spea bombifrons]